ncbi:alpha/beta hydrolase family protein [Solicola sp. PLA-1-18]|uniref:S9 family peptidase n=1 Tax=Solicola sp. PLA-1-18 TaxID=3380532 RepID=UPI003B7708D6
MPSTTPRPLPHGSWPSPVSARDTYAGGTVRRSPHPDGDTLYWLESRPDDAGRVTLVRVGPDGVPHDVSPPGQDVRTRIHEYGGGDVGVRDGVVLWVEQTEQRVWRTGPGEEPRAITPPTDGRVRFGRFALDLPRGVAYTVREDQRDPSVEPVTSLVRLALDGADDLGTPLVAGRVRPVGEPTGTADATAAPDFVADPVLSPGGGRLAWLTWNHPDMAWDSTYLWVGGLDDAGDLVDVRLLAGGDGEAIEQPLWLDDDRLVVVTDRSGWGNHAVVDVTADAPVLETIRPDEHDLGQPRWTQDQWSYDLLPDGRLLSHRFVDGYRTVVVLDPATGDLTTVPTSVTALADLRVWGDRGVARAFFADRPAELVTIDLVDGSVAPVAGATQVDPTLASRPEPVSWPTPDGALAHGFLYRPTHPDVVGPDGELPPLIVTLHGGPTAASPPAYSTARTFWTSRGFAVLDVNYGGSVGYGREYRRRLQGTWGVVDVQDAASGARHLADTGVVDGDRLCITGGSAGGFTTLAAMTTTDVFAAGASHFGVSDLGALARDTHKLESRYLWGLVAPWPEGEAVYDERSPLTQVDRLSAPLILLQGTEDRVVPPAQAHLMADALRAKGLPVALVLFEGEGHGFRALDNQVRALECELSFYAQVFGFTPADDLVPVEVENLP